MEIGIEIKRIESVPLVTPVQLPKVDEPIPVENWPVRREAEVPEEADHES